MSNVITDEQAKTNISRNVRYALDVRGWKAVDLARATDESEMRISLLVRGKKLPTAAFLARVAEALDTTADALLRDASHKPEKISA